MLKTEISKHFLSIFGVFEHPKCLKLRFLSKTNTLISEGFTQTYSFAPSEQNFQNLRQNWQKVKKDDTDRAKSWQIAEIENYFD